MTKRYPNIEDLKSSHTVDAIRKRLAKGPQHSYLRDFIYGSIDGTVTTFAVIAGVAGAALSIAVVIILGFCNLLADGLSMAASNFLGTRAEQELSIKAEKEEQIHIALIPEGEKEEIRQIFAAKGFKGNELEAIVSVITSDVRLWLKTMVQEELGLPIATSSPFRAAIMTFFAFVIIGVFPLLPFVISIIFPQIKFNPFLWSVFITAFAFFIVGALKGKFVEKKWYKSGAETLLIGGCAAGVAYLIGMILKGVIPH